MKKGLTNLVAAVISGVIAGRGPLCGVQFLLIFCFFCVSFLGMGKFAMLEEKVKDTHKKISLYVKVLLMEGILHHHKTL